MYILSASFLKGDNLYLFVSVDSVTFSKRGVFFNERICSYRSKCFLLRCNPHIERGVGGGGAKMKMADLNSRNMYLFILTDGFCCLVVCNAGAHKTAPIFVYSVYFGTSVQVVWVVLCKKKK